jgi:hypothetical protein
MVKEKKKKNTPNAVEDKRSPSTLYGNQRLVALA